MVFDDVLGGARDKVENYLETRDLKKSANQVEDGELGVRTIRDGAEYLARTASNETVAEFGETLNEYADQVMELTFGAEYAKVSRQQLEEGAFDVLEPNSEVSPRDRDRYEEATGEVVDEMEEVADMAQDRIPEIHDTREELMDLYDEVQDVQGFDLVPWGKAVLSVDQVREGTEDTLVNVYEDIDRAYAQV